MANPYTQVPARGFWKPAVGDHTRLGIEDLWRPKFPILATDTTATAGSCFAQHISRTMVSAGFNWLDSEPAPRWLTTQQARAYGYGVFSFRTGNIYTAALLRQWLEMALEQRSSDTDIWTDGARFSDPLRPAIETNGFASAIECLAARAYTLRAIRQALPGIGLLVFTLGLTEAWRNTDDGLGYPMCPGTVAGTFDPARHAFHNYGYEEILADLSAVFQLLKSVNPEMRFLLTVSPVPLTATASSEHVLVATSHSKAVLRAVAGQLAMARAEVDYFPSYEIISSFPYRGAFYAPNMRDVTREGVDQVMGHFFRPLGLSAQTSSTTVSPYPETAHAAAPDDEDVICEDIVLDALRT